jgi:hypothetical protein
VRFRRGTDLPDDVSASLGLAKGEKALASAALTDGAWVVGTDRRLLVAAPAQPPHLDRAWYDVDTASWDGETGVLGITWITGERSWLSLADEGEIRLPTVLRERVEASVVARHQVRVRGRGGARLVVRRVEGKVVLQTVLDPGTDPSDPLVAEALHGARAELVEMVGDVDGA